MNIPFVWPADIEPKVPTDPPDGKAIEISDEVFDIVMLTATYMGALKTINVKAHEAMLQMADAEPVVIDAVNGHAVKAGGVHPIVVTLSVVSAAQHAIESMDELMAMDGEVN